MFSILFVMDEFIRYLWLVIVRTMDFLRTNSCVVAQGIEEKDEELIRANPMQFLALSY